MKSLLWITPFILLLVTEGTVASESTLVKTINSPAKEINLVIGNSVPRKAFTFSGGTAWLDADGNFHLEMSVAHQRIRCARYQTNIQFGVGNAQCQAASWIASAQTVSNKKHCNSAKLVHTGGNWSEALSSQYQDVSCARVQVLCTGKSC